jgi:hypothetical protein
MELSPSLAAAPHLKPNAVAVLKPAFKAPARARTPQQPRQQPAKGPAKAVFVALRRICHNPLPPLLPSSVHTYTTPYFDLLPLLVLPPFFLLSPLSRIIALHLALPFTYPYTSPL